ncbi:MAG TPA: condensation domain-containing protein, partial [Blastocatellia bacterium]|nr:condensation domain-containing protein [Blastocatellia bacterium]
MREKVYVISASYAQQRLWFLDQLDPLNTAFIIPVALSLRGPLAVSALYDCLNLLISRHESFRTCFTSRDGSPVQMICPSLSLDLPLIDLCSLDYSVARRTALDLASQLSSIPFDLSSPPLMRACLIKLSEQEHLLALAIHHIICDGWSMAVFYREMATCYEAFSSGRVPQLPELDIQYADFALWQNDMLERDDEQSSLREQLQYWAQQLGGDIPLLALPTDRNRPAVQSYHGQRLYLEIPAHLVGRLRAFALDHRATLFMTLLSAFFALLHRLSGQSDITVGTAIAGRTRPETEPLIGLFLNTLVLRASP